MILVPWSVKRPNASAPSRTPGVLFLLFCLVAAFPASAMGNKEPELAAAEGLENWQGSLDLTGLTAGKYNLVVEAEDKAGNVSIAGPMNIFVDPASDLPRVVVVNPYSLMRVGGDLNVVGTAKDDDGVSKVEVKLDSGEFATAEGTEFWSLYLKTRDIPDGRRSISVRAVDVNGLEGPIAQLFFNLDRAKPIASVESPLPGSLVLGQVTITGSVFDANGVTSLDVSLDEGKTWKKVDLRREKEPERSRFVFSLDTKKLADGPKVIRFHSVDGVGSSATDDYLIFVDNTKPEIRIARPASDAAVNGRFTIAGAVHDIVGLKRLSYDFAGLEKGEITLTKGDPYFVKEFDATNAKADRIELALFAEDSIGNISKHVLPLKVDRLADKPILKLEHPAPGGWLRPGDIVWGTIADDDGVSAIRWSLDGAKAVELPASEFFSLDLPRTISGKHTLALTPVDSNGLAGDIVTTVFSLDLGPGSVSFERVSGGKEARDFFPGFPTKVDGGDFLEGSVQCPNPSIAVELRVSGSAPRKVELQKGDAADRFRFKLPLDRLLPYGFAELALAVTDSAGNSFEGRALAYVENFGAVREDTGFRFADPRMGEDGGTEAATVVFGSRPSGAQDPIVGSFYREELAFVLFEPATDLVEASFDGGRVSIRPLKDGVGTPIRLVGLTKRGHAFSAGPYSFITDARPPELVLSSPSEGAVFSDRLFIEGRVADEGGLAALAWRILPDGNARPLERLPDGSFSATVAASELPPGSASIEVEAKDVAGNVSRVYRSWTADVKPPVARFLAPEPGGYVRGSEDVAVALEDPSGIASVEYAEDGTTFAPIAFLDRFFAHRADFSAFPGAAYRVRDRAGNETIVRPSLEPPPDRAEYRISDSISVEAGEGEALVELAGGSGARKLALVLPGLSEEDFAALDISGSAPPPERFATRALVSGNLSLKGSVKLPGLVKAVSLSLDGGANYALLASNKDEKSAKAVLPFAMAVDSAKSADGEARWVLKVEDFSGSSYFAPLYCLVDNEAPALALVSPEAPSMSVPGPFPLVLRIEDRLTAPTLELAIGATKEMVEPAGGRYVVRVVDPSKPKASPFVLVATVKDKSGNVTALAGKYAYDPALDAPRLTLATPAGADPLEAGSLLSGAATDDSGIPEIDLAIDGGEALRFGGGSFALPLPALKPGKHQLLVRATDSRGARAELKREIAVRGAAPAIGTLEIGDAKSKVALMPGMTAELKAGSAIFGLAEAFNGLASVEVSINGGAPIKASLGKPAGLGGAVPFSAALPVGLPYARTSLELRVLDSVGLTTLARVEFHNVSPSAVSSDDADGLRFFDERVEAGASGLSARIAPGDRLIGRFNGRPIARAALSPPAPQLAAQWDGSRVFIDALSEGLPEPVTLTVVTTDGDSFSYGPLSIRIDSAAPTIELKSPSGAEWLRDSVSIAGASFDVNGVVSVEAIVNGGAPIPLEPAPGVMAGARDFPFDSIFPLGAAADGTIRLDLVARDGAGRESRVTRFFNKDTIPPALSQVIPAAGESVNGTMTIVGEATDSGRLVSVSFMPGPGLQSEETEGLRVFSKTLDFARLDLPLPEGGGFAVTDKSGNVSVLSPDLVVDKEKDKPIVAIEAPADMEVMRSDYAISGVAYDDDGLAAVFYRLDGAEWIKLESQGNSFSVPLLLKESSDNEHLVEVKAEDIYGVQGDTSARRYRVSKEEPVARMTAPSIDKPIRGSVELVGDASDANQIDRLSLSVDNRVTFDRIQGAEEWRYRLDTESLQDGLHPLAVRPVDKYDTEGFYATFVTIDNTPPEVVLDLPEDGQRSARELLVSGRVSDKLALASSRIEIAPIAAGSPPVLVVPLGTSVIVRTVVDISGLAAGDYSVRLFARDRADNENMASKDVTVTGLVSEDSVEILFPREGSSRSGLIRVYGRATIAGGKKPIVVVSDGEEVGVADADELGYFAFDIPPERLSEGIHNLSARSYSREGLPIESLKVSFEWNGRGPWVVLDNYPAGSYLPDRPWLEGRAGWETDRPEPADKATAEVFKREQAGRAPVLVEVSTDDGRTFKEASGTEKWRFRLETQDYSEGRVFLVIRARYANGMTSVHDTMLALDKTPPAVAVAAPMEDGRYNGIVALSGTARDAKGLKAIGYGLRQGDKKSYEVPAFIQGLYLEGHLLGATTWEVGLGLTFFQDNVKLQAIYGSSPETADGSTQSFFGSVIGAKLIANLLYLPFNTFFGPDWEFLSMSLGLGANFSYFTKTQSGSGLMVGAVIGQIEFPKITMKNLGSFKKYSLYAEFQLWMLSSVLKGGFVPKAAFGARVGIF